MPHVVAADVVLLTEGEKKADVLSDLNLHDSNGRPAAVTTSGGADSWRFRFVDLLKGKKVVTLPDMDGPEQKYCDEVTGTLTRAGIEFTVVYFDEFGNDVRDFLKLWRGTLSRLRS